MMTVHEVSSLTGVSIRTLQYYDRIGLLHPAGYTDAGYRLYDDAALETLQQILLFRDSALYYTAKRQYFQSRGFFRKILVLSAKPYTNTERTSLAPLPVAVQRKSTFHKNIAGRHNS